MDRKKIELIVTGILLLVFLVLLVNLISKPKRTRPASDLSVIIEEEREHPKEAQPEAERKDLVWGRDPFGLGRAATEEGKRIDLVLNGIIWDKESPYAIINEEVVGERDMVSGYTVIKIKENSVILDDGAEKVTLRLW